MGAAANATPAQRKKFPSSVYCGPNNTYPIQDAGDIRSAARLIGKADDPEAVKRCILRKAKNISGGMDAVPDAWKPAKKDVTMDTLVHFGGSVKALGEGRVGGYLVMFGDPATPDLSSYKDYFTKSTDFDIEVGDKRSVYYAHGIDATMGVKKLGTLSVTDMAKDDVGVWVEAQLSLRDEYEKKIYSLVEAGKMGWSSGAPSHLVRREAVKTAAGTVHEVKMWPIGEGSITPTPAEPRIQAVALKSLAPLIGMDAPPEDHTIKALPSGMSYDDLRALLQDELNEDIGDSDDPYGPGLWIVDIYDDALVYRDDEDLIRIPYTVTAGNDVTWGEPETVIRTTVYVTATDDDDDAGEADAVPMSGMSGKQADVTALKAMLRDSMTFSDHADIATSAIEGFVARAESLTEMSTKAGRVISSANRDKMKRIHAGMQVAHDAMAEHMGKMGQMLAETDPDAKKDAEDFAALRTQFVRLQSELLSLSG